MAGTIGRGGNAAQDMELANWLTQDDKNINENQYVVDDILQSLSPHSDQVHLESELRLVRLRKVQHLKRNILAHLHKGINGVQLLQALQPTAAVAGLPRAEAMQYIQQNEPFARGWYAGSVGYLSMKKQSFVLRLEVRYWSKMSYNSSRVRGSCLVPSPNMNGKSWIKRCPRY